MRRKIFLIGVIWFTIASAACALAPDSTTLIVMRVLQGVGGALLTPGSLAIIQASFDREDRGRAIVAEVLNEAVKRVVLNAYRYCRSKAGAKLR